MWLIFGLTWMVIQQKISDTLIAKKETRPVYYRLKITDANGKVQYSNVLNFSAAKRQNNSTEI